MTLSYEEDFSKFSGRLKNFYGTPEEVSFARLRVFIRRRFLQLFRGVDSDLRSSLENEADDVVEEVIERLIKINTRYEEGGIENVEAMATEVTRRVFWEALRKALEERRRTIDESDVPVMIETSEPSSQLDDEIDRIKASIKRECLHACLKKLPAKIQALFTNYYPDDATRHGALAGLRANLAEESGAVGARSKRKQNNLQKKVWHWRENKLKECVTKCFEDNASRHTRLAYLEHLKSSQVAEKK